MSAFRIFCYHRFFTSISNVSHALPHYLLVSAALPASARAPLPSSLALFLLHPTGRCRWSATLLMGHVSVSPLAKVRDLCAPALAIFILLESVSVLTIASAKGPDNRPIYNSATVVLCAEQFKLAVSLANVWEEDPWLRNYRSRFHWPSFLAYALPALLYAVNNNIYLKVLTMIHPSIFQLFMNLRVVWTGLVFRFTLQRTVTPRQWAAMLVLFAGCALTVLFPASSVPTSATTTAAAAAADVTDPAMAAEAAAAAAAADGQLATTTLSVWSVLLSLVVVFMGLLLTLAYTFISTAASVIGEVLLKGNDSLHLANAQLYFFGVLFNGVGIALQGSGAGAHAGGYFRGWDHPVVWAIVVLMAVVGLVTSRIMKNFDSIVKIFCVSIGNFVVYAYSVAFQGQSLALSFITAFFLVSLAAYSYQTEKLRLDAAASSLPTRNPRPCGGDVGDREAALPLKPLGPRLSAALQYDDESAGLGMGMGAGAGASADSITDGVAALLDEDDAAAAAAASHVTKPNVAGAATCAGKVMPVSLA